MGPEDVRERHERLVHHLGERRRQHLLGPELRAHDEAGRAGAAHAERVPHAGRLELGLTGFGEHEDLIAGLHVGGAAQRRQQVVGVRSVAHRGCLLLERQLTVRLGGRHRRDRAAHVTAGSDLGGDRCDKTLVRRELAEVILEPRRVREVARDREHLDLVHRVDHRRRGASAAELEAALGDRVERRTGTAERLRHGSRQRARLAKRGQGLGREAGLAVDGIGKRAGHLLRDAPHARHRAAVVVSQRHRTVASWAGSGVVSHRPHRRRAPRWRTRSR